jgi:hypothetical protein
MQLIVQPGGDVCCLYGESINLSALGRLTIQRASYVEPDTDGAWWADLTPVAGPKLGPFAKRTDALAAEVSWLEQHWLCQVGR